MQIAAIGRVADIDALHQFDPSWDVIGPSSVRLTTAAVDTPNPRSMTLDEIREHIEMFANAAEVAVQRAGFDGIELHGGSGFLIDEFLQDVSNRRTDNYSGSIENRSRFALEVVDAIAKKIGQNKTAIRFSPWNRTSGERGFSVNILVMSNKPCFARHGNEGSHSSILPYHYRAQRSVS